MRCWRWSKPWASGSQAAPMMLTAPKGYFAAAVMMPHARFSEAALETSPRPRYCRPALVPVLSRWSPADPPQRPGRARSLFHAAHGCGGQRLQAFSRWAFDLAVAAPARHGRWSTPISTWQPSASIRCSADGGTFLAGQVHPQGPAASGAQRRSRWSGLFRRVRGAGRHADGLDAQEPGPIGTNCRLRPSTMRAPRLPGLDHDPLNFCMHQRRLRGDAVAYATDSRNESPHWAGQNSSCRPVHRAVKQACSAALN